MYKKLGEFWTGGRVVF